MVLAATWAVLFFDTIASDLLSDGIGVVRFDFNGHGKSEGRFQDMTVLNEIEDAKKSDRLGRATTLR